MVDERFGLLLILKAAFKGGIEDLPHRAEVFPDFVYLLDNLADELQIGIILTGEVEDDNVAGLTVPIQTAVSLFEARRIPGDVEVEDESRGFLQVQSLGGHIGGNQDADG